MKGNIEFPTGAEHLEVDEGENAYLSDIDNEEDGDQDKEHMLDNDSIDHTLVRGIRSLVDVYSGCDVGW